MIPQTQPRKKKNSSKVNLTISFVVHAAIVVFLFYFAAREGFLGKQLKKIAVTMVHEKPPEKPKEPPKPKIEPPKVAEQPKPAPEKMAEAPKQAAPPTVAPPVVAPANSELPAFDFGGGHTVVSESDPVQLYKGYMEYALRQQWNRPENLNDDNYVAEVAVNVDKKGDLSDPVWLKGSGNAIWDASVKEVFKVVKAIDRPPPTNFPPRVTIKFDIQTEPIPELQ